MKNIFFFSDVHFGLHDKQREKEKAEHEKMMKKRGEHRMGEKKDMEHGTGQGMKPGTEHTGPAH